MALVNFEMLIEITTLSKGLATPQDWAFEWLLLGVRSQVIK